jgi:N-acetylmuramoyl-L-alanine amidase
LRKKCLAAARLTACLAALLFIANCAAPPAPQAAPPAEAPPARASSSDVACLAEAIYFEARGTGDTGTRAVAHVVLNRARSPKFPDSVCGVIADRCQFSYRCDGRPDQLVHATDRAHALRVAETVLEGAPDITRGALFFHAASMEPGWFGTRPKVGPFGGNVFYR